MGHSYFGRECDFFCGQWERGADSKLHTPDLVYCSHPNNPSDVEGNCNVEACPLVDRSNVLIFRIRERAA